MKFYLLIVNVILMLGGKNNINFSSNLMLGLFLFYTSISHTMYDYFIIKGGKKMSKLYFKYGTVNSSKSANLLMTKHNYEEQGLKTIVLKSTIDTREPGEIVTRAGIPSIKCIVFSENDSIKEILTGEIFDVVLVDEAQFCTELQIEELWQISIDCPVICFGLKTDSHTRLFPGSKRLLELAEKIEEIKTVCKCGKKATINARIDENGNLITNAPQIDIGGNEKYIPMCKECFILATK